MAKNVVICCDGTGNSFDNPNEASNVVKLYSSLVVSRDQAGYYHPGVGTMGDPTARYRYQKELSRLRGLAFGKGLFDNLGDAYRYLMNTYVDGDAIFIFGFSRGAYTARALASLLHMFGLLCAGNDGLIPYILKLYAARTREARGQQDKLVADETFKWQFSHSYDVKVQFCGLWDTVSAYGWVWNPIMLPFNGCNPIILKGRHAVSIHERRCFYRDNLWSDSIVHNGPTPRPEQDIKQVWFAGVHSDVGGSYPEAEAGLSKIALEWMLVEARAAGLLLNDDKVRAVLGSDVPKPPVAGFPCYSRPDPQGKIHPSLHGPWWLLECLPHRAPDRQQWRIPFGACRTIPPGSLVHESVKQGCRSPIGTASYRVEPWVRYSVDSSLDDRPCRSGNGEHQDFREPSPAA